jgi:predicted metal-dependent phosphotriesterase family hydrolase
VELIASVSHRLGAQWLRTKGFADNDLNRMLKENPARLMSLPAS